MLIADMPDALPSIPAVVIMAQASHQLASQRTHEMGVCGLLNRNKGSGSQFGVSPVILANGGLFNDVKIDRSTATITILEQPNHGYLKPDSRGDWAHAWYVPDDGYLGHDSFVVQVEGNGYKTTLRYFVYTTEDDGETVNPNPVCKGATWKISQPS